MTGASHLEISFYLVIRELLSAAEEIPDDAAVVEAYIVALLLEGRRVLPALEAGIVAVGAEYRGAALPAAGHQDRRRLRPDRGTCGR